MEAEEMENEASKASQGLGLDELQGADEVNL